MYCEWTDSIAVGLLMVIGGGAGAGSGGGTGGDEAVLCIYISFHILHKICLLHIFTMPIRVCCVYVCMPHYIRPPLITLRPIVLCPYLLFLAITFQKINCDDPRCFNNEITRLNNLSLIFCNLTFGDDTISNSYYRAALLISRVRSGMEDQRQNGKQDF